MILTLYILEDGACVRIDSDNLSPSDTDALFCVLWDQIKNKRDFWNKFSNGTGVPKYSERWEIIDMLRYCSKVEVALAKQEVENARMVRLAVKGSKI